MDSLSGLCRRTWVAAAAALLVMSLHSPAAWAGENTFSQNEVMQAAENFFGVATKGLAQVVQKVIDDLGEPNAVIAGAIGIGFRYDRGHLNMKGRPKMPVFWQGPSIGFDLGGNVSKAFVLIYHLASPDSLFQRFPGVDGSFYVVAGVGVNYQKSGNITLAPIRTGVGLRAGASVGYLHYTRKKSWIPF
jgi:hypothetical protein